MVYIFYFKAKKSGGKPCKIVLCIYTMYNIEGTSPFFLVQYCTVLEK